MKSTFLLLLMMLLTAFTLSAQTTIGINAGVSYAKVTGRYFWSILSLKYKPGLTAGIFLNKPLSENFIFQPALNFVQKGYKIKDSEGTETVNLNYIEIPLNFLYFLYSGQKNAGFFIGGGPTIAYAISGTDKFKDSPGSTSDYSDKIKFGKEPEEYKALDFGINAIVGYRLANGLMLSANYNFSLSKINNDDVESDEKTSIKNKFFSFKIGYTLHKKSK